MTAPVAPTAPALGGSAVWRRLRVWVGLLVAVVIAAAVVAALSRSPGEPLSTTSTAAGGSRATAAVLRRFGVTVRATTSVREAEARSGDGAHAVLVTAPADYSAAQLRRLGSAAPLVLVRPDTRVLGAVGSSVQPQSDGHAEQTPGCADPGANAAGELTLPSDALTYSAGGGASCYGGLLVTTPRLVVLGSADVLRNDHLGRRGDAALVIDALTRSRSTTALVWLRPGADAAGSGPATVWALFPDGVRRAFWWLAVLVVLVALWRGRRLGAVVQEPLPVIVRAAEVVEGHGRLYERAGARDRAAAALRRATTERLRARFGLPRDAPVALVAATAADSTRAAAGYSARTLTELLGGPVPNTDAALRRLAVELAAVESSIGEREGNEGER